ncbi:Phosphoribulokinase/uridine kinase [Penicillium sp. DV-2018c]|nr:Phosphoribulokinase/uridine kinase [Penicillium sp. DV-2018c]KAJ5567257.1 Phosphoribulokinase/uridine kinase [Penicillium sp. DV-2018c]
MSTSNPEEKAIIIGISGPSSSGKTTLARLLQRIFCGVNLQKSTNENSLNTFIIHEDDFYFSDDKIPYTTTPSGTKIQDWDTPSALDLPFLSQSLHYVRQNGRLPPRLQSKEDQNSATESGVPDETVAELRDLVEHRLEVNIIGNNIVEKQKPAPTLAFLEGFLLFAPPNDANHVLREVHDAIHLPLFLPAPYGAVKERREGRTGYVTVGPAVEPPKEESKVNVHSGVGVDLEGEGEREAQNFWVDPPGYVDDVVWPRYVRDHAWLLVPEGGVEGVDEAELVRRVGEGTRVRRDVGVEVAPGDGRAGMDVVLRWAVEVILGYYIERM